MDKYLAVLGAEAVAASTAYVLVDLSDTTNFPHANTRAIVLHDLYLTGEKASTGIYDIWVGVVTEVDATNGSVDWLQVWWCQDTVVLLSMFHPWQNTSLTAGGFPPASTSLAFSTWQ